MFWIILIFFMVLGWIVSSRLKSKFKKYGQIPLSSGMTGREVAEQMLRDHRIYDVTVTSVPGKLTDHYNPGNKTVNLSEEVYYGNSAAAAAVAAHECGHAVQHADAYSFLEFRSVLVPVQNISSKVLNFVFLFSLIGAFGLQLFPLKTALLVIIICYAVITLFSFVTLPVEFDASKRALAWIERNNVVNTQEYGMSKDALKWAAMTYVVAAVSSATFLVYYVLQYLGMDD